MKKDLHKRIEEAAKKMQRKVTPHKDFGDIWYGFNRGAELGYKEAIKVAKEWLENNLKNYLDTLYSDVVLDSELLTDFENNMNKLWEEKK